MPVIRAADATVHEAHGSRFVSYANRASAGGELRAWRLEVPGATAGLAHRISREEVFYLLSGALRITIDGVGAELAPGDAAVAPAGSVVGVDNPGEGPAAVWVTTGAGLGAVLPDGSWLSPPWAA
ncbi:cupin domain-containing protein [Allonocardiopsis opalescens]|uniref:Mannose-6-phosphate isomerase-like protein (Cupin superfamily) n=1 Tax=Allonocardiopsis opalescens TaxID=1144618 RepID=A0A2T0Q4R5_9ACTN|nr:cupin domain-containing protein [Allonocardiopsis opalescens]PRX98807.1 mannose-6-phosphate isomerase-like protein (cupin superfamily) [Allonocardiopsis opalescens]